MGSYKVQPVTAAARGSRWAYYQRVFAAYVMGGRSQLTFWHETPEVNEQAEVDSLGQYYMTFVQKADYPGPYDDNGIPLLDYRGRVGVQYNPIAIAQYGLGNYNLWKRTGSETTRLKFLRMADWLAGHLEPNPWGISVWNHHFDWEYRELLKAPWYSALAQGQGISLLVRAYHEADKDHYLDAARRAFESFLKPLDEGGVLCLGEDGDIWFEEYLVSPPTHILNGFIWASWGVYDYFLTTGDPEARHLFIQAAETLAMDLYRYDVAFWSLYELSGTRLKMLASPFYHRLHIIQLEVLFRLTGEEIFQRYTARWRGYQRSRLKRMAALGYKAIFKLLYY